MLEESPLGQTTVYVENYTPDLLFPVSRELARGKTGIREPLAFKGVDVWNAFELSWLNDNGKPEIALAELIFPCTSSHLVESKSLKLYFNSFNQTKFTSFEAVAKVMENDLSKAVNEKVTVKLYPHDYFDNLKLTKFSGLCLDNQDITADIYHVEPNFLKTSSEKVEETLYTNLFKSNCLATGQPDWGSVWINYCGNQIEREGLLKYFISFRRHSGFAEHCTEQIFYDLMRKCAPEKLSVNIRYTRRGGLDINPFRSNFEEFPPNLRQIRQ